MSIDDLSDLAFLAVVPLGIYVTLILRGIRKELRRRPWCRAR